MRGSLSVPRAADLAAELPYGSQTWLAVETDAAWTTETHHLGFLIDEARFAAWQRAGGKGERPTPWPRPAEMRAQREEQAARFDKLAAFEERRKRREEARRQRQLNPPS